MSSEALEGKKEHDSVVEQSIDYIEKFDILETINNVGNDEVFTPVRTCKMILDLLPEEVWSNPNYKWLNPCDKNGVFLREIAIRLNEGLKEVIHDEETRKKHILKNMLFSIGLTRFTSLVSRRTVYYCAEANRHSDGCTDSDGHLYNGNSIRDGTWFDTDEGNILTPIGEHHFENGRCIYCKAAEKQNGRHTRYSDPDQMEHYAYEFVHVQPTKLALETHLQKRFFKGDKNMKFDIIIGNPPYHLNDGGGSGSSAISIYQYFVENAIKLNPKYMSFIIPSRWMTGGKGLDVFRDEMIHDKHITVLHDYANSGDCFNNVGIEGGVCYFLRERDREGKCNIYRHGNDGKITFSKRYLVEEGDDIYIRDTELLEIKNKVVSKENSSFEEIVSSRLPYGIGSDFFDKNAAILKDKPFDGCLTIFGYDGKRITKYISDSYNFKESKCLYKYKVFISKARGGSNIGANETTSVLSVPILGEPKQLCTETYLEIGPFDTKKEAENCISYIKTKFFRCLVAVRKQTQNAPRGVYKYVPLLDFCKSWTDAELYKMYDLSEEDIKFIEDHIEAME